MPRSLSIRSREYQPGKYGPFSVDGFTNQNTTALEWTATNEGWPDDRSIKLFTITLKWDNGDNSVLTFHGGIRTEDGKPVPLIRNSIAVPTEADGTGKVRKVSVASGTIEVEVFHPITTTFTLEAVR